MLGIAMPVWLTETEALWESTRRALGSLRCSSPARVYVVPNRLHRMDEAGLLEHLQPCCECPLAVLPWDGARSVAAAWNQGIRAALRDGCSRLLITANDCYWHAGAIDEMIRYDGDASVWSGFGHVDGPLPAEPFEGCDFTGFMVRPETVERVGWFDERFRPAYFEDNDYATRVVMSGGTCRVLPTARFDHAGSLTVRTDAEAAHHVRHWFELNRQRYKEKWGADPVPVSEEDCLARCYRHPWNDPAHPVTFWDR